MNDNPCIKWCTAKDCTNAVQVQAAPRVLRLGRRAGVLTALGMGGAPIEPAADVSPFRNVVACSAGHYFCFRCLEEPHSPADCADVKRWFQKCKDDSETCNWLQVRRMRAPRRLAGAATETSEGGGAGEHEGLSQVQGGD